MKRPRPWVAIALVGLWILTTAQVAGAHDPVFVADEQTTPDTGPYFPDGTVSWAIYSTMHEAGETRGFEFDLADGDRLILSLLIPNLEPELSLTAADLPTVVLELPDGSTRDIEPVIGSVFDEPFSGTSYIRLHSTREDGMAGRHRAVVKARAPARVSVAIGDREVFGTPAERAFGRDGTIGDSGSALTTWYSTPPGAGGSPTEVADTTGPAAEVAGESAAATLTTQASTDETTSPVDVADAYVTGPQEPSTTDRLLIPMTLLAVALVVASVARTVARRLSS